MWGARRNLNFRARFQFFFFFFPKQTIARLNEQAANFEKDIERLGTQIQSETEILGQLESQVVTSSAANSMRGVVSGSKGSAKGGGGLANAGKKRQEEQQKLSDEDKILMGK